MDESLLHFIWKFRLFDSLNLKTTQGENLEISFPGIHNIHAGPDFSNARIKIGKMEWAGNIELHLKSSDWFLHRHEDDRAYDSVILHVVYEDDGDDIKRNSKESIPTLCLKNRIQPETISRYRRLMESKQSVPCAPFLAQVPDSVIQPWLIRLMIERLESKVEYIQQMLQSNRGDWENTTFQLLARYMGSTANKEPFEMLARSLPIKVLSKHAHEPLQIEALIFGQAGLLDADFEEEYPKQLKKEYLYLKRLHQLQPLPKHLWKLLRMRPSNFPTIRLAQLAALLNRQINIFSLLTEIKEPSTFHRLLDTEVSTYWHHHYLFDRISKNVKSDMGPSMKNVLLINVVAPLLFTYGKSKGDEVYCERALQLLESCPPESNAVIKKWAKLGLKTVNSSESQALLQLHSLYCSCFRCVECAIGWQILK